MLILCLLVLLLLLVVVVVVVVVVVAVVVVVVVVVAVAVAVAVAAAAAAAILASPGMHYLFKHILVQIQFCFNYTELALQRNCTDWLGTINAIPEMFNPNAVTENPTGKEKPFSGNRNSELQLELASKVSKIVSISLKNLRNY